MKKLIILCLLLILIYTPAKAASNTAIANRLKGYILLQTESNGEAWYINPTDAKRYYMKDGAAAYEMLRQFGLGISNRDLEKIPVGMVPGMGDPNTKSATFNRTLHSQTLINRLKGKILLQVEALGEAWYVYPKDGRRYYMKDGNAAYQIMRSLSLGITNKDLAKLLEGIQLQPSNQPSVNRLIERAKELGILPVQSPSLSLNIPPPPTNVTNITELLSGVVHVNCGFGFGNSEGSGSLWNLVDDLGYVVVTNRHVVTTPIDNPKCWISVHESDAFGGGGLYLIDIEEKHVWNYETDIAIMKIKQQSLSPELESPIKINDLNYKVSSMQRCPGVTPLGTKVYAVGYPVSAETTVEHGDIVATQSNLTITDGIISAYDRSVQFPYGNFPNPNYFISAKIDSGNSGGIAVAEMTNGLCLLGIPTWVKIGNYATQGLVQNIHNVLFNTSPNP